MAVLGVVVTLLAVGALYQGIAARRHRRQFTPPGQLIDVGGHRLHVICRGSGSPVVLLESGIAASSLSWAVVQPEIAKFTRVCAYDRAGLAWSDVASSPRSFERIVDELSTVLARVASGKRYVLVGHSFGSFVVRAYAARHPSAVLGLVLVDPPTEWLTMTPQRARHAMGWEAFVPRRRRARAHRSNGSSARYGSFRPTFTQSCRRFGAPKCLYAMADHLRVLEREGISLGGFIPPREIPVIVISSGDQPPEQIAGHRMLAERSANGRHVIAARSAHWVQFDEPELVVSLVRELVERA